MDIVELEEGNAVLTVIGLVAAGFESPREVVVLSSTLADSIHCLLRKILETLIRIVFAGQVLDSTDHVNSCKPLSRADPSYKDTLEFLKKLKSHYSIEGSVHK